MYENLSTKHLFFLFSILEDNTLTLIHLVLLTLYYLQEIVLNLIRILRNLLQGGVSIRHQEVQRSVSDYKDVTIYVLLQFEYGFIDKFPSDELPEPPSCLLRVYAEDSPETEKFFHYLVPLEGVTKPEKIFIHLSLRSSLVAGS